MIAGGLLLPGDLAPSAPALSAQTGTCLVYCLRALRALVDDGTLEAGKTPHGRPRVPGVLRAPARGKLFRNLPGTDAAGGYGSGGAGQERGASPVTSQPPRDPSRLTAASACALAGGIYCTPPDREFAAAFEARFPGTAAQMQAARVFCARAAERAVTEQGVRGVIVAPAGYPCSPDPHTAALEAVPAARFCFCDPDPEVTLVNRAVLGRDPRVTACRADAAGPARLMSQPETAALPRPLLVLLPHVAVHWPGDFAADIVAGYARLLPPGSMLAMTTGIGDGTAAGDAAQQAWRDTGAPVFAHTPDDLEDWVTGAGLKISAEGVRDVRGHGGWAEPHWARRSPGRIIAVTARVP